MDCMVMYVCIYIYILCIMYNTIHGIHWKTRTICVRSSKKWQTFTLDDRGFPTYGIWWIDYFGIQHHLQQSRYLIQYVIQCIHIYIYIYTYIYIYIYTVCNPIPLIRKHTPSIVPSVISSPKPSFLGGVFWNYELRILPCSPTLW